MKLPRYWSSLENQNPLTAKGAKILRKERKELISSIIALRSLQQTLRSLRLKRLSRQLQYRVFSKAIMIKFPLLLYYFSFNRSLICNQLNNIYSSA